MQVKRLTHSGIVTVGHHGVPQHVSAHLQTWLWGGHHNPPPKKNGGKTKPNKYAVCLWAHVFCWGVPGDRAATSVFPRNPLPPTPSPPCRSEGKHSPVRCHFIFYSCFFVVVFSCETFSRRWGWRLPRCRTPPHEKRGMKTWAHTLHLFPFSSVSVLLRDPGCLPWLWPTPWLNPWVLLLHFREK